MDPFSADTILYLRAIQGHSGGKHVNPTLQDNVLLPSDFAEHIYHVGSSHDTHSIIQSGLIPGWQRRQERETCGVLYGRESNVHRSLSREGLRRDEAQDCSVQTQWKIHQNAVYWCNLRVAQSKGVAVLSNAIKRDHPLQHFTCDVHREGGDQEVKEKNCTANVSVSYCTAKNCTEAELA